MGRKLRQFGLLIKKNYVTLWQRKISVVLELLVPIVLLVLINLLRFVTDQGDSPACFDPSGKPQDLNFESSNSFWNPCGTYDGSDMKIIAVVPANDDPTFVVNVANKMLDLKMYALSQSPFLRDDIDKPEMLNSSSYADELQAIIDRGDNAFVVFPNHESFQDVLQVRNASFLVAAVVFSSESNDVNYTIRYPSLSNYYQDWRIDQLYSSSDSGTSYPCRFVFLQQLIDTAILFTKNSSADIPFFLLRGAPTMTYDVSSYLEYGLQITMFRIVLIVACLIMVYSIATDIVEEKCSKMREVMRMMGLSDFVMWAAWYVQRSLFIVFISLTLAIGLEVQNFYPYSDGTLIFVYLLLFFSAQTMFVFFLTSFQHNLRRTTFVMMILTFATIIPALAFPPSFDNFNSMSWLISLLNLLPLSTVSLGFSTIDDWEKFNIGVRWSNLGVGASAIDPYPLGLNMLFLFLDIIIYAILTWYIENVYPGEFGIANVWYFMFTPEYWGCAKSASVLESGNSVGGGQVDTTCHEKVPGDKTAGIAIRNLGKTFHTLKGDKTAVQHLSMEMFEGQITALLGHNGAGKTTTINMLTGMYPPTSGDALVLGHSIKSDIEGVRMSMGVCPQHNTLFKYMTVEQHLDFFIRLKGVNDEEQVKKEIKTMLEALSLKEKRHAPSHTLSGGQKRKLSVGIALSGGSKVVMLDEPTTGMDVSARRDLWDVLLKLKEGRTIVFTTHSMDEADLLGDRIAIMAAGDLVCSGSSLFLKRRFGVGYHLTLVKNTADMTQPQIDKITAFIRGFVPSAQCNSNVGSELSYLLSTADVSLFVDLFRQLEEKSEEYGIVSFGVSLTTMEEVFMKAGEGRDSNLKAIREETSSKMIRKFDHSEMNKGPVLMLQQLTCQLLKRAILAWRNKITTLLLLVASVLLVMVAFLIGLEGNTSTEVHVTEGSRLLTLQDYPSSSVNAAVLLADLRKDGNDNYLNVIKDYLAGVTVDVSSDATEGAKALKGTYGGTLEDCCHNPFIQMNETCYTKYYLYEDCVGVEGVTRDEITCVDSSRRFDPPMSSKPEVENLFMNYYLEFGTNYSSGDFRINNQGAITLADPDLPYYHVLTDPDDRDAGADVYYIAGVNKSQSAPVLTAWVSPKGTHLIPAFQSALSNIASQINQMNLRIHTTNEPLQATATDRDRNYMSYDPTDYILLYVLPLLFTLGTSFILASFTQVPVDERTNKSKHLQQISGVNSAVYWTAMFLWDYLYYTLALLLIFIIAQATQSKFFVGTELAGPFAAILMLSGLGCVPMIYVQSHVFSKTTTSFGVTTIVLFIVSYVGVAIIGSMYKSYTDGMTDYEWVGPVDVLLMILSPHYSTVAALRALMYRTIAKQYSEEIPDNMLELSLNQATIGRYLLAIFLGFIFWFGSLVLLDHFWFIVRVIGWRILKICSSSQGKNTISEVEDDNVTEERQRLESQTDRLIASEGVVMYNLHKQFGSTTAVQNVSVSIAKGECFGLLGVNGAGKTTTFNMITGDVAPTSGAGFLYGYDVTRNLRQAQRYIGYCPQFDAFIGQLTGRELLTMYAYLRGVPYAEVETSVQEIIEMFNLEDHADKICMSYSGGNKRKLSTGIAIIGSPPLIFLDEPTAGMDPTARRFLWNVLCYLRSEGCSVVLTSHSMEECEALCTRIVIMVNGANRCLGSVQELKSKYSQGYTLCLLMEPEQQSPVESFVYEEFPGALQKESYPGYLMYSLGTTYKWSQIFEIMETNKTRLGLLDYSVAQTTLEQVFLNFAKEQRPQKEKVKGCLPCCKKKEVEPELEMNQRMRSLRKSIVGANLPYDKVVD